MKFLIIHSLLLCSFLFSNIIDINSKQIDLNKDIKRVLAIGPGALRLVTIMNLQDKIVGIEKREYKNIPFSEYRTIIGKEKIMSLPIIGAGGPGKLPNLEKIITLKPDIIISSFISKKQLEIINKKTNIPIISLSYGLGYGGSEQKIEAIKKSLLLLGKVFQKEQRANHIVSFMNNEQKKLKEYKVTNKNIYVGGMGFKGAHGLTSSEKYYPSFELLDIINPLTFNAKTNHTFIQEESLIAQNPDYIFLDMYGKKIIKENFKSKHILYTSLQAYKQEKIFWLLAYNFYNTNIANVFINSWIILSRLGYDIDVKEKMTTVYDSFYINGAEKLLPSRYPIEKFR